MLEKFFSKLDKAHMTIGVFVFGVGTLLQALHRLDTQYVAFASAVLSYLGAHLYLKNGNGNGHDDDESTPQ